MKKEIRSLTIEQLKADLGAQNEPPFRAGQVFSWVHEKRVDSFMDMSSLPLKLRERLAELYYIELPRISLRQSSKRDGTEKFLLQFLDGERVEAVWMEYKHGNTVCISTQVGCRMGCKFCASTVGGLVRNLSAGEMLGEVYAIERAMGKRVGGVVLMGIGEPLDNIENVVSFIRLISDKNGMNLSPRHISLSTCGLVPEIDVLAEHNIPLTLSVSLHAPDNKTRDGIMPVNKKYPVEELLAACGRYFKKTGRRISFEYALLAGKNDTDTHAAALIKRLSGERCHVNIIPVNEVSGREGKRPKREESERFLKLLQKGGLNATIRRELGSDISAACGQLRRSKKDGEEAGV